MLNADYLFDYYGLWASGRLTVLGLNPYDIEAVRALHSSLGIVFEDPLLGHFPHTMWLYGILALLPFALSRVVWGIILLTILYVYCTKAEEYQNNKNKLFNKLQFFLITFSFFPVIDNLRWGQCNPIVALGLLGFLFYSSKHNWRAAGLSLAFTTWKFHLFLPFYAYIFITSVKNKNFDVVVWGLMGVTFQIILTMLLSFDAVADYPEEFLRSVHVTTNYVMPSLPILASHYWELPILRTLLPLLGIIFGFCFGLRRKADLKPDSNLIIVISLLVSPYCWSHTFLALFLPYLNVVRHYFKTYGEKVLIVLVALGLLQYVISIIGGYDYLMVAVPILLTLFTLKIRRESHIL